MHESQKLFWEDSLKIFKNHFVINKTTYATFVSFFYGTQMFNILPETFAVTWH